MRQSLYRKHKILSQDSAVPYSRTKCPCYILKLPSEIRNRIHFHTLPSTTLLLKALPASHSVSTTIYPNPRRRHDVRSSKFHEHPAQQPHLSRRSLRDTVQDLQFRSTSRKTLETTKSFGYSPSIALSSRRYSAATAISYHM